MFLRRASSGGLISCAVISTIVLASLIDRVEAQVLNSGDQPFRDTAKQLKGQGAAAFGAVPGYTTSSGFIVTPTIYGEVGHDGNPDRNLAETETAYGRTGGAVAIAKINKRSAGRVVVSGSALKLSDDTIRDDRWEAGVSGNWVFALAPGLTLSSGGLFRQDEIDFIPERVGGGFTELAYRNKTITSFVRARYLDIQYLGDPTVPTGTPVGLLPFFRGTTFDATRKEISAGLLIGNNVWLAPYTEFSAAEVDYTNQADTSLVDRDGHDYFAKGGLRVTPSRSLQFDIGWRWNWREIDDPTIRQFHSNYFDASVTWRPSPFFKMTGGIDRTIGEPSSPVSRLADIKAYRLGFSYVPVNRWSLNVVAKRETIDEIGDIPLVRRRQVASELSYALTPYTQFYWGFLYEHVQEDRSDSEYERLKMGIGTRTTFGGQPKSIKAGSTKDVGAAGPTYLEDMRWRLPRGAELDFAVGYSYMNLPGTHMTTVVGGALFDTALGQLEDHDGDIDGIRLDLKLRKFGEHAFANGKWLSFSVGGFYTHFDNKQHSSCRFTATTDCAFVNIVDFDLGSENNTGPFGDLQTTTRKLVHYWGVELDATLGRWAQGGLKDGGGYKYLTPFRFGLGFRGLNQKTDLHAIDLGVPDPVDYNERLDTYYYGGFIGYERAFPIGRGLTLSVDAQAGIYYAHTSYEGRYQAYVPVGGPAFVIERGAVDAGMDDVAFIGGLKLDLSKSVGWGVVSIYGKAEYLSHVPKVALNNNDEAGGSPFGVIGTQVGTQLSDDDAVNWSAGIRVRMPIR